MGDSPTMDSYCTVSECEAPTREGRTRCDFHEKRHQRGQPLTAPKVERLPPKRRLVEAALRLADAETDECYSKAERDLLSTARKVGPNLLGDLVRQGHARARQQGVRLGAPPRMTYGEAMRQVAKHGSLKAAVRAGVASRNALRRALRRGPEVGIANPSKRAA